MAVAAPSVVKLTVNLPSRVYDVLDRLAKEQHTTKTEALRRAISTEAFRWGVQEEGGRILVEKPDGKLERVNFPY